MGRPMPDAERAEMPRSGLYGPGVARGRGPSAIVVVGWWPNAQCSINADANQCSISIRMAASTIQRHQPASSGYEIEEGRALVAVATP